MMNVDSLENHGVKLTCVTMSLSVNPHSHTLGMGVHVSGQTLCWRLCPCKSDTSPWKTCDCDICSIGLCVHRCGPHSHRVDMRSVNGRL